MPGRIIKRQEFKEWMHKKAIEWLFLRAHVLCSEHRTVCWVYLMLGAKGLGLCSLTV